MKNYELKNLDAEDIEDWLLKVESSFDIKFVSNELVHVKTLEELCDSIADKIKLEESDESSIQQAFYKLQDAIALTINQDKKTIRPESLLSELLPRQGRRSAMRKLEEQLEVKLDMLHAHPVVTKMLALILFAFLVGIFINWRIGLTGTVLSIVALRLVNRYAKHLEVKTVSELAAKMSREHYLKSRRNPHSFNKMETKKILIDWFIEALYLEADPNFSK